MNEVATRLVGTGLMSREALSGSLNKMASSIVVKGGDFVFLRLSKDDGVWEYGQDNTEIDPEGIWAVNISSFRHGYIAWHNSQVEDEVIQPINRDLPPVTQLGSVKAKNGWEEQKAVQLIAVSGGDKDVLVDYKASTEGSKRFFLDITNAIMAKMQDPAAEDIIPLVKLSSKSYPNKKYGGTTYNPVFTIVGWRKPDDATPPTTAEQKGEPAPAQAKAAEPEQPAQPAANAGQPEAPEGAVDPVPRRRQRRG